MRRMRWYVGWTDKHGKLVQPETRRACVDLLLDYFGGCTAYNAHGVWRDEDGKVVTEYVGVLEVLTNDRRCAEDVADQLAVEADQDSVLWSVEHVEAGVT